MTPSVRNTPRQAAYRDLCAIITQLAGRSRRAQRAMLETELVRALERAYEFQARSAELVATVRRQEDELAHAAAQVAGARVEVRRRILVLRQEVFAVIERCKAFERSCRELLEATECAVAVEPPALVARPPEATNAAFDPDQEADTERGPAPSGSQDRGEP
jgi:hypothetical protein